MMHLGVRARVLAVLILGTMMGLGAPGWAANRFYVGPDGGSWTDTANWSATSGGAGGASVPVSGDVATVAASSGNVSVTTSGNYASPGVVLTVDGTSTAMATVQQATGSSILYSGPAVATLVVGLHGMGQYIQNGNTTVGSSGGTLEVGQLAGSTGTYQLAGGALASTPGDSFWENVGDHGNGTVIQSGGTNTVDLLYIGNATGSTGSYQISSGQLTVNTGVNSGGSFGSGSFVQSGGTTTVSNVMLIKSITLSAGQMNLPVTQAGTYMQTGGTATLASINSTPIVGTNYGAGTYEVDGGTLTMGVISSAALMSKLTAGNGGRVNITNASTLPTAATLTGAGVVHGQLTVPGTLSPGSGPGVLTVQGNLALTSQSVLRFELGNSDTVAGDDRVDVFADLSTSGFNGNLTLDGTLIVTDLGAFHAGTYTLFNYQGTLTDNGLNVTMPAGYTGAIVDGGGVVSLVATSVPEPGALMVLGLGVVGLLRGRRRKG